MWLKRWWFKTHNINITMLHNVAYDWTLLFHHNSDVIMGKMASKITGVSIVYSTICSGADQRKYESSASLAFVRGIHLSPVNSLYNLMMSLYTTQHWHVYPDSKIHGTNMGSTWVLSAPDGPHVGPMNRAIRYVLSGPFFFLWGVLFFLNQYIFIIYGWLSMSMIRITC